MYGTWSWPGTQQVLPEGQLPLPSPDKKPAPGLPMGFSCSGGRPGLAVGRMAPGLKFQTLTMIHFRAQVATILQTRVSHPRTDSPTSLLPPVSATHFPPRAPPLPRARDPLHSADKGGLASSWTMGSDEPGPAERVEGTCAGVRGRVGTRGRETEISLVAMHSLNQESLTLVPLGGQAGK